MIDHEEIPTGFTMELAMHADALNKFARLPKAQQEAYIDGAKKAKNREQMHNYVEQIFR